MDNYTEKILKTAENMLPYLDKTYETTHKLESENASRVVWLVALAGFAIVNAPNFIIEKNNPSVIGLVPWILTALFGVFAHISHRNVAIQNFRLYTIKREMLSIFVINGPENATFEQLNRIIKNETDNQKAIAKDQESATRLATIMETLTFVSFVLSLVFYIYLIIYPLWQQ